MARTMKLALAIIGISFVVCLNGYTTKFDHVDVKAILENDRLRDQYYQCVVGVGPCVTADAKFFRDIIVEAYLTDCAKCNVIQKSKYYMIQHFFMVKKPEQWKIIKKFMADQAKLVPAAENP